MLSSISQDQQIVEFLTRVHDSLVLLNIPGVHLLEVSVNPDCWGIQVAYGGEECGVGVRRLTVEVDKIEDANGVGFALAMWRGLHRGANDKNVVAWFNPLQEMLGYVTARGSGALDVLLAIPMLFIVDKIAKVLQQESQRENFPEETAHEFAGFVREMSEAELAYCQYVMNCPLLKVSACRAAVDEPQRVSIERDRGSMSSLR